MVKSRVDARTAMQRQVVSGIAILAVLGGTATAWASLAKLDSAIVAPGVLVVEGNSKKVQHPTGGVVGKLMVKEGQRVKADDLLLSLDDTATRAQLGIVNNDLTAYRIRLARLIAERDDVAGMVLPADLLEIAKREASVKGMIDSESKLLSTRRGMRKGQKEQLTERVGQLKQEIAGTQEQREAAKVTLKLAQTEYAEQKDLLARGLTQKPRVTTLEREVTRTTGTIGELDSKIPQLNGRITETELQITQVDRDAANEVQKDMRDSETKIGELQERRITALDLLKRIDIRAPISGTVLQLGVHTVGGVITPSDTLMMIVPEGNRLEVEVQINPQDIDQVKAGLPTRVRFTAFSRDSTPEVNGELTRVAADLTKEPATGRTYFTGAISFKPEQLAELGPANQLLAGMPAEAYIRTGERTFASYIFKPIFDHAFRGFRER
jgi:HlyD family secretion protein